MNVDIFTSDPEAVDPKVVFEVLTAANFFVLEVDVNEGERHYTNPELAH